MEINLIKFFFFIKFSQETVRRTRSVVKKNVNKSENITEISQRS